MRIANIVLHCERTSGASSEGRWLTTHKETPYLRPYVDLALDFKRAGMQLDQASRKGQTKACIAIGEGVSVPVRICFDEIPEDQRPRSGTANFSSAWSEDVKDEKFIETVVERWRNQGRL